MSEIERLLQAFYLLNDLEDQNEEYIRGQSELICDVLGLSLQDLDRDSVVATLWSVGKRIFDTQE